MVRKTARGSKHAWKKSINTEAEQQHAELMNDANAGIVNAANDALFFTDTTGHVSRSLRKKRKFMEQDDDTRIRTPEELEAIKQQQTTSTTTITKHAFKRTKTTTTTTTITKTPTINTFKTLKASHHGDPIADIWGVNPSPADQGYTPHTDQRGFTSASHVPLVNPKVQRPPLEQTTRGINQRTLKDMLPEEGLSFNPDKEKHKEILNKVLTIDARARQAQRIRSRRMRGILPPSTTTPSTAMSDDDDETNIRSDASRHITVRLRTQAERNRETRRRELRAEIRRRRFLKEQNKQLDRVPVIIAELKKQEKLQKKKREARAQEREANPDTKPQRLGKHRYQESFPEVALTEEVEEQGGSLRKLKPSPFLVRDQFKRFQARSLIEPRIRHKLTRRYALKEYKRNAFKGDLGFQL